MLQKRIVVSVPRFTMHELPLVLRSQSPIRTPVTFRGIVTLTPEPVSHRPQLTCPEVAVIGADGVKVLMRGPALELGGGGGGGGGGVTASVIVGPTARTVTKPAELDAVTSHHSCAPMSSVIVV